MSRRSYAFVIGGSLVVAAGLATGIALAFGGGGRHELTAAEYRARVAVACDRYGRQLDRIPPPTDLAVPGEVTSSIERALPVLKELSAAIRAIPPPGQLRARADRLSGLRVRSIASLEEALAAGRKRDLGPMGQDVFAFFA